MFSSNKDDNERTYLVKIDKLQTRCAEAEAKLADEVKAWEAKYEQDMDEVKQEIARYSAQYAEHIDALEGEKVALVASLDDAKLAHEQDLKQHAEALEQASAELQRVEAELQAEHARSARKVDELRVELDIMANKLELLGGKCANDRKLVERKDALLDSQSATDEHDLGALRIMLREAQAALKAKATVMHVANAKFDRELSVLNDKMKYYEQKPAEVTASYDELQTRY